MKRIASTGPNELFDISGTITHIFHILDEVFENTCYVTHHEIIDVWPRIIGELPKGMLFSMSCVSNQMRKLCSQVHKTLKVMYIDFIEYVVIGDHIKLLEEGLKPKSKYNGYISFVAACVGNLNILKWLRKKHLLRIQYALKNSREIVHSYYQNLKIRSNSINLIYSYAASNGHLHVLKWFYKHSYNWESETAICSYSIATNSDNNNYQFVGQNFNSFSNMHLSNVAAEAGCVDILEWIHEIHEIYEIHGIEGPIWNEITCHYAAIHGNLDVLKCLHNHKCPWDQLTCMFAARCGKLEVLKWLREKNCPWDESVCANAARRGHLEVLQWARQNNCPWNSLTCSLATKNDHTHIVEWAHQNGCPCNCPTIYI